MTNQYLERLVDLTEPSANRILNMTLDEARGRILARPVPKRSGEIDGSFALVAKDGKIVRMARSLDRPLRYFLAKRHEGPALVVAHRIDTIWNWLKQEGFAAQFHPSYTRMVPAHYVVQIQLVGCPDPDPVCERFFTPPRNAFPTDCQQLGENYIGALAHEITRWLSASPSRADRRRLFRRHRQRRGIPGHLPLPAAIGDESRPAKGLHARDGRRTGSRSGQGLPRPTGAGTFSGADRSRSRLRWIRSRPFASWRITRRWTSSRPRWGWRFAAASASVIRTGNILIDGDGGDENLKDYPIEENPELTINSVVNNACFTRKAGAWARSSTR